MSATNVSYPYELVTFINGMVSSGIPGVSVRQRNLPCPGAVFSNDGTVFISQFLPVGVGDGKKYRLDGVYVNGELMEMPIRLSPTQLYKIQVHLTMWEQRSSPKINPPQPITPSGWKIPTPNLNHPANDAYIPV